MDDPLGEIPDDVRAWLNTEFHKIDADAFTNNVVKPSDQTLDPSELLLFQYTNARSALSILESGSLWATHFESLNDT
jgi:hypothetical protein